MRKSPLEMTLEERKVDLVKRLFIESADNDYLTARWQYSHAMSQQFFWSAAQALEKYLKALLLLNDESVLPYRHNLSKLLAGCERYGLVSLSEATLTVPDSSAHGRDTWVGETYRTLVEYFGYYGSPDSRYGEPGTHLNGPIVHFLDDIIARVRTAMRHHNAMETDLFKMLGRPEWSDRAMDVIPAWALDSELPLESLFARNFHVGQSAALREVFIGRNTAFAPDEGRAGQTFGGLIYEGSALVVHLIHLKNPHNIPVKNPVENRIVIDELKAWVTAHIPLSKDMKAVLNDPNLPRAFFEQQD